MAKEKYRSLDKIDYRRALLAYLIGQGLSDGDAWARLPAELSIGRAGAARDIKTAEIRRWLVRQFDEERFEEVILDQIREEVHHRPCHELETELRAMSGGVLKGIWVFNSSDKREPASQVEWDWQMGNLARNSDWLILRLLLQSKSGIAVGWGKTIAHSIIAVAELMKRKGRARTNGRKNLVIIPTVGTPPHASPEDLEKSSTKLAANLSDAINGTWKNSLSLENVWPIMPAGLSGDERKGFLKAILLPANYEAIFGNPDSARRKPPLIDVVDTCLTSAGAFHTDSYFLNELVRTGKVSREELMRLASGDIGSALVPSKEVEHCQQNQERFGQILNLLTGIRLTHYQSIARRAAQTNDPQSPAGVILCALNGNKANIVLELIRHQAVSTLVADYHLVNRLNALLGQEHQAARKPVG